MSNDDTKKNNSFLLNGERNDKLSKMSLDELTHLTNCLYDYKMSYRDKVNLTGSDTFGIEIEYINAFIKDFPDKPTIAKNIADIVNGKRWLVESDSSLGDYAGELISPIMQDKSDCWHDLYNVCSYISPISYINNLCGGHIHIGTQVFKDYNGWTNFFKLWLTYENVIFKFLFGEYDDARSNMVWYAKPVKRDFIALNELAMESTDKIKFLYEIFKYLFKDRYFAVNLSCVKNPYEFMEYNTIEIRAANGTTNPIIWQNNITFLYRLFYYANSSSFDEDIINKRYQKTANLSFYYGEYYYTDIQQAVELCDMIFDNNLEKLYFLKQYLKKFDVKKFSDTSPKLIKTPKNML